jgi:hypothetical protein
MNDTTLGLGGDLLPRTQPPRAPSRAIDTREFSQAPQDWVAPGRMPEPDPKEGIRYKWVRVATQGIADKTNMHRAMTQGYVPVNGVDVPELSYLINQASATANKEGLVSSSVEYGGLILMQINERAARQRDAYYRGMHVNQEESIDTVLMQNEDARMPLRSKRKSKVVIGGKASDSD